LWGLEVPQMIWSRGMDFHPYQASRAMLLRYNEISADEKEKVKKTC